VLDPFYAFAFDSELNEFYTVTMRQDPKNPRYGLGLLHRYSYPDFKEKAVYNLPNLATRAVIDPKRGVLFLASCTKQGQMADLWSTAFDRASAIGDVQAFDLKPIRDGKVIDGADIKPVGTLATNGTIRGLELTNDGKFLCVAVTRSVPGGRPKTFIRQYEASERKYIKEQALVAEALDMRKSADGKQLLAIEYDSTNRNDKLHIMTCDPVTLEMSKTRVSGIPTDVTTTPDGMTVVASAERVNAQPNFRGGKLFANDEEIGVTGWKASNNNYAKFSPDGKKLFTSSFANRDSRTSNMQEAGFDVYEATGKGFKKIASIRDSIRFASSVPIGGYFEVTPDSEYVIFHSGAILAVDNLTKNAEGADKVPEPNSGGGQAGLPGGPGGGRPGIVLPPGGGIGIPPGGGVGVPPNGGLIPPPGGGIGIPPGGALPLPGGAGPLPGGPAPPGNGAPQPAIPGR
jgi:hypothetical protein